MLIDCLGCHHAYDVSSYKVGQRLRCRCGQILVVPGRGPDVRIANTLHCSNCGGNLEKGVHKCPFCDAVVDLTHARMTAYCPSCLSMSKEGARFCSGCGTAFVSRIDTPEEVRETCPHCKIPMRRRGLGEHRPMECPMCCGLFVEVEIFDQLIREQENRTAEVPTRGGPKQATVGGAPVKYIRCPVCCELMNRINYGKISGVIVDFCRNHGYWLDTGELEKIAAWVSTGGLSKTHALEIEEAKSEKARLTRSANTTNTNISFRSTVASDDRKPLGTSIAAGLLDLVSKLLD